MDMALGVGERAREIVRSRIIAAVDAGVEAGALIPRDVLSVAAVCDAADASTSVGVMAIRAVARETGAIQTVPGVGVRLIDGARIGADPSRDGELRRALEDVRAIEAAARRVRASLERLVGA